MIVRYGLPVIAIGALAFSLFSVARSNTVEPAVAPPAPPPRAAYGEQVGAAGLVEAASENIAVSLPVPGLVTEVFVSAGDMVRKGQPLFRLDDRDLRADLALRQTALQLAKARLARLEASPRQEDIPPAEARVREAEAQFADAEVQRQLIESVRDRRAVREEDRLRRRRAAEAAKARLEQTRSALALLKAGAWGPDLQVARAEVAQAEQEVKRRQTDLDRMVVTAPISGQVLQCKVRKGEYAQAGPLAQPLILLGDVTNLHIRADIDEKDAWRVRSGAPATASIRGNADLTYEVRFVRFEPYVVPKRNLTGDPTERVDTRVLQAIYQLPKDAPVYPGQQMDVFIQADNSPKPAPAVSASAK